MKIKIKSNNSLITGDLTKTKHSKTVVVFLSGIRGGKDFPLFKTATSYLCKNHINTLRLNLFDFLDTKEITLDKYAKKMKDVYSTLESKYSEIILVGHSFGAIISIIFLSKYKKNIKLILWEPTRLPWRKKWMQEDFYFDKNIQLYIDKHTGEKINDNFYNECIKTNSVKQFRLLKNKILVIASKGSADKDAQKYTSHPIILNNSDHYFNSKRSQKKLFTETLKFIN